MMEINCRARITPSCLHGQNVRTIYGDDPISTDGTWNGRSVICTPCYAALLPLTPSGRGELHELNDAIRVARVIITAQPGDETN